MLLIWSIVLFDLGKRERVYVCGDKDCFNLLDIQYTRVTKRIDTPISHCSYTRAHTHCFCYCHFPSSMLLHGTLDFVVLLIIAVAVFAKGSVTIPLRKHFSLHFMDPSFPTKTSTTTRAYSTYYYSSHCHQQQ